MADKIKFTDLQPGDILFYRKTKFINKAISFFDDCKYNHNALYVGESKVIESIISGTVVRDIQTSIADAQKVMVKRLDNAPQDTDPVIKRSKEFEGDRYAYEEILMLALICSVRKIRFGKFISRFIEYILEKAGEVILAFTNGGKEALTCSELVYRCYNEAEQSYENQFTIHLNRFDDEEMLDGTNKTVHNESILAELYDPYDIIEEDDDTIAKVNFNEKKLSKAFKKQKKKYKKGKFLDDTEMSLIKKKLGSFVSKTNKFDNTDVNNVVSFIKNNADFVTPGDLYNAINLDEVGMLK